MINYENSNILIACEKDICPFSMDSISPIGAICDNHTNEGLIRELQTFFSKNNISLLDIGCAGGQMVVDVNTKFNGLAIGLDCSTAVLRQINWSKYRNEFLFLVDTTEKMYITNKHTNKNQIFDVIQAWESIEHLNPNRLQTFFENIKQHMDENSIFICSISHNHCEHHPSAFSVEWWREKLNDEFLVFEYIFQNKLRICGNSSFYMLKKREKYEK